MHIRIDDPTLMNDLVRYLRRCDFLVHEIAPTKLEVAPVRSFMDASHLRIELEAFLRVWRAMNGSTGAALVDHA